MCSLSFHVFEIWMFISTVTRMVLCGRKKEGMLHSRPSSTGVTQKR